MKQRVFPVVLVLLTCLHHVAAQGTVFTYQGRLMDGSQPANGSNYGMMFYLYDAPTNGNVMGNEGIVSVTVSKGLFTVPLDFGNVFDGNPRWLEITVQKDGGSFTTLAPRQMLTPTPYAFFANTASNVSGTVSARQLSGSVPLAQLPVGIITNGASGVNITGTFSGDGAGVTNVSLTLNSGGVINLSGGFVLVASPGVGDYPISVCAADVNGDGKMDLISANYLGNTLTVLTNNGRGGFVLAASPGVGINPHSVCAADVNGDGKMDLISANFGGNTLTVLTNNGSGGFVLASSPGVGSNPYSICAADVNGDGKMDLISANRNDSTLTVLTNNGSGGFVLASSPGVGSAPLSVCAADVNGDGRVDLISANANDNTLTVLTNNGSGGFVLASSPGVDNDPVFVCAADVNGDGKMDLISANIDASTLTVLFNTPIFKGDFIGDGSGVTALNAANLTGTLNDARLSANVPRLNANQTFSGINTFTSTLAATKWKANTIINQTGPLPITSGAFVTSGGTLVISASGSGYCPGNGVSIGMNITLDGAAVDTCIIYVNAANDHIAFMPKTIVKTGIAPGAHHITLSQYIAPGRPGTDTATDNNDTFCVTVQELPF